MFDVMKIFTYLESFAAVLCVVAVITLWQDCEHSEYFLHSRVTKTNGQITLCVNQLCGDPATVCNYAAGQRRPSINKGICVSLFSINQRSFHMNTSLSLRTKSLKRCQNVTTVKKQERKLLFGWWWVTFECVCAVLQWLTGALPRSWLGDPTLPLPPCTEWDGEHQGQTLPSPAALANTLPRPSCGQQESRQVLPWLTAGP